MTIRLALKKAQPTHKWLEMYCASFWTTCLPNLVLGNMVNRLRAMSFDIIGKAVPWMTNWTFQIYQA